MISLLSGSPGLKRVKLTYNNEGNLSSYRHPNRRGKMRGPGHTTHFPRLRARHCGKADSTPTGQAQGSPGIVIVAEWRKKKASTKQDLLSLIGSLSHACKAIKPGRTFSRRLFTVAKHNDHFIRLNKSAQSDIEWWKLVL